MKRNNTNDTISVPKTLEDHMFYGFRLDPEQKHFRDCIWDEDNIATICDAKSGSGKAQPINTIIPTPSGYRTMGSLQPGDYVFDRFGRPTQVLGVYPQGLQKVYKVTLSDGRSTLCAKDHLWTYYNQGNRGNFETATLFEMMQRSITTKSGAARYRIPNNEMVQYNEKTYPVDPYVFGALIGDGCCTGKYLELSNPEEEIVKNVADLLNASYSRHSDHNYSWSFKSNINGHKLKCSELFGYFSEYINTYSYEKHIPIEYLTGSINQRLSLLQGLMDTDGTIQYGDGRYNVSYSTTSYKLASDIAQLAYSLGFSAAITQDNRGFEKYTAGQCFRISFRVPNNIKPIMFRNCKHKLKLAMESTQFKKSRNYEYNIIRSIEDMGYYDDMICIYVDNPEHLYLTNDFIVTHNTLIALGTANLLVQYGRYSGITYIVFPTMEQKQGFIPGSPEEKNAPYIQPLRDALFSLNINPDTAIISESNIQAIKDGKAYINFMSHTYLRGTNIENQVVIVDEFQNGYGDECKKVLTRIHDSAKVILIGQKSQCDIIKRPEKSGFDPYLKAFKEYKKENPDDKRLAICELKTNHRGWFSNFCDEVQL